jgi:hypothetical protein
MTEFKPGTWYSIETAPTNGIDLDLWIKCSQNAFPCISNRESDCIFSQEQNTWVKEESNLSVVSPLCVATHWMPKPKPPEREGV